MPIDPYLARGITPLGAGLGETVMDMNRMREVQRRTAIDQQHVNAYEQDVGNRQLSAQKEQEMRAKYAEMVGLSNAPPEYQAKYIDMQKAQHPEFLQTPFAQMEPRAAFAAMRDALAAQLGEPLAAAEAQSGPKIGQYNPGDYTPQSWAPFLKSGDPSGLQRQYAPPAPPNQTVIQLPQGQAAFNPRTGQLAPLSLREDQRTAEVADVMATESAKAGATAAVEKQVKQSEKDAAFNLYETARDGLLSGLEGSRTGPIAGRIPAVTAAQQVAEGGVAAMAPVLKQLFRVAGEGVFTDRDQQLLTDMIPKRSDLPDARKAKIQNIDAIVKAKLGKGGGSVRTATGPNGEKLQLVNGQWVPVNGQ